MTLISHTSVPSIPQQWAARADDLAAWVWRHLVNRTDVWGGYRPASAARPVQGQVTKPADPRLRGTRTLRQDDIERHFRLCASDDSKFAPHWIVGLHSTSPDETCMWGAVDYDAHSDDGAERAAAINLAAALTHYAKLVSLGFRPLLTTSNRKGGLHLRVIFDGPVSSEKVYALMGWLVSDFAAHGMIVPPETFPKQPRLDGLPCGNWLRLFGRHHSADYWSRVWDGEQWLDGDQGAALVLQLVGDSSDLIPSEAVGFDTKSLRTQYQQQRPAHGTDGSSTPAPARPRVTVAYDAERHIDRRIAGFLALLPTGLGEGNGRTPTAYKLMAFIVRDLSQDDATALYWAGRWDAANAAPLGDDKLQSVLRDVHNYGRSSYGAGLADRPDWKPKQPWEDELSAEKALDPAAPLEFFDGDKKLTLGGQRRRPHFAAATLAAAVVSSFLSADTAEERAAVERAMQHREQEAQAERQREESVREAIESAEQRRRERSKLCPNCQPTIQAKRDRTGGRVIITGCDRYDCQVCRRSNIERWQLTFSIRIQNATLPTPGTMFEFYCPEHSYAYTRQQIAALGGKFYRVASTGMIYATVAPSTGAGKTARPIDKADAISALCLSVEAIPETHTRKHPITHSHGWGFPRPDKPNPDPIFENVGKGHAGENAVELVRQVLADFNLAAEEQGPKSVFSRIRRAIYFNFPSVWGEARKSRLYESLMAGETKEEMSDGPLVFDWGDDPHRPEPAEKAQENPYCGITPNTSLHEWEI